MFIRLFLLDCDFILGNRIRTCIKVYISRVFKCANSVRSSLDIVLYAIESRAFSGPWVSLLRAISYLFIKMFSISELTKSRRAYAKSKENR